MTPISLPNLVAAYRKAKVDLFYASNRRRMDLVKYESDLGRNLGSLLERIHDRGSEWFADREFLGGFAFEPKSVSTPSEEERAVWSDPVVSWHERTSTSSSRPVAEFRLMSHCSVDFHVLSTLWMLEVGTALDGRLRENAFGNRLRKGSEGAPNRLGVGSFVPYQIAYQQWREGGLNAMRSALSESRTVTALTADVTAFYHRLDPRFLQDEHYLAKILGVTLDEKQAHLNRTFIAGMLAWASMVGKEMGWSGRGLPVGLPASAVVANLALAEFDNVVVERCSPRYYGRYVDDVLLVLEDQDGLTTQRSLWEWIANRSGGLLEIDQQAQSSPDSGTYVRFAPPYLASSEVIFENAKNKVFYLSGRTGEKVLDSMRTSIRQRSSEWRSLVTFSDEVESIDPPLVALLRTDGDTAVTLRDTDVISARRQSFSIRLRDLAVYERNLPPDAWVTERREFFRSTCDFVLALPEFFKFSSFLPRLVSLASACGDHESLAMLLSRIAELMRDVKGTCQIRVASFSADGLVRRSEAVEQAPIAAAVFARWTENLVDQIFEEVASAWTAPISSDELLGILAPVIGPAASGPERAHSVSRLRRDHYSMAQRDLAYYPYRWSLFGFEGAEDVEPAGLRGVGNDPLVEEAASLLVEGLSQIGRWPDGLGIEGPADAGIVLATRPPTMSELQSTLAPMTVNSFGVVSEELVSRIILGLRGQRSAISPGLVKRRGYPHLIEVPFRERSQRVRVALAMLEVDVEDAKSAAAGKPNLSVERFNNVRRLLDSVAKHVGRPQYLLLPELALPARWFNDMARGLRRSGISLISGVEHQATGKGLVANQVWAALAVDGLGLPYYLYRQDKQRPAHPEKTMLTPLGLTLRPRRPWTRPPVIDHGGFRFALLVCSELTNIDYRAHLRGSVDALFVPEWNRDLNWFEAIVESASLDLHAYIAQANTLGYGDTRVRAPMKEAFARDVVRLKGGTHDYFVTGDLEVEALRRFQGGKSSAASEEEDGRPDVEFKPLPDGFSLDPQRRA